MSIFFLYILVGAGAASLLAMAGAALRAAWQANDLPLLLRLLAGLYGLGILVYAVCYALFLLRNLLPAILPG